MAIGRGAQIVLRLLALRWLALLFLTFRVFVWAFYMQELDNFEEFWKSKMLSLGYAHVYERKIAADKMSHGLGIFFRTDRFERVKYEAVDLSEAAKGMTGPQFDEVTCLRFSLSLLSGACGVSACCCALV